MTSARFKIQKYSLNFAYSKTYSLKTHLTSSLKLNWIINKYVLNSTYGLINVWIHIFLTGFSMCRYLKEYSQNFCLGSPIESKSSSASLLWPKLLPRVRDNPLPEIQKKKIYKYFCHKVILQAFLDLTFVMRSSFGQLNFVTK